MMLTTKERTAMVVMVQGFFLFRGGGDCIPCSVSCVEQQNNKNVNHK